MSISKVVPIALILVATGVSVPATSSAQTPGVREVTASPRTLIALQTRLRYTTMIVLPDSEEILDVICGDRDFWVISATRINLSLIAIPKPFSNGWLTAIVPVVCTKGLKNTDEEVVCCRKVLNEAETAVPVWNAWL